jgi:beta-lactamase class A
MLRKKVPLSYLILSTLLGIVLTFIFFSFINKPATESIAQKENVAPENKTSLCLYNLKRLSCFKFISPIVSVEPQCESNKYAKLKNELANYITSEQQTGLQFASVYLWGFSDGDWMAINPDKRYLPGSLLKVAILITYLKMAETDQNLLNSEVTYRGRRGFVFPIEHYRSDTVMVGHKYKIKDLLRAMITFSDNRATLFLENVMDTTLFKKEFSDLGMAQPNFQSGEYMVSAKEYATFMKALYNSAYLSHSSSEYALSLLTQSGFKNGLVKDLPPTVTVAHKFGEAGDAVTHQLHESGIIYLKNNPYLLTVMTQGTDWDKLSNDIGHISAMVYDNMIDTANKYNTE